MPGQTSYHDNDYAAAGRYGIDALDDYDVVCIHVEAPDEAGHAADPATKVAAVGAIDEHVVGPVHAALEERYGPAGPTGPAGDGACGWRMLVLPDHYTLVNTRKHDPTPVPFLMAGANVKSVLKRDFSEANANASDLHIERGHELMEYFLRSGL